MKSGVVTIGCNMFEYLNAINFDKKNIIRNADDRQAAEKGYPAFPVLRSLSYHADAILLANELNIRGLEQHGVTPLMSFEFLMDVLPKKKRFAKWGKTEKDERIELLMEFNGYSYDKAKQVVDLIPDSVYSELREIKAQKDK